jgi:hypothetical protein
MPHLAVYKAKKCSGGIVIDFMAHREHPGPLTVHLLSDYKRPHRQLREEYFAALEVCHTRCWCLWQ